MAKLVNKSTAHFPVQIGKNHFEDFSRMKYARTDQHYYKPFEHEVKAQQRKEAIKEVGLSLLAFCSLIAMLSVGWMA